MPIFCGKWIVMTIDKQQEDEKFKEMEMIFANMEEIFMGTLSIAEKTEELQFFAKCMMNIHENDDAFLAQQFNNKDENNETN